MFFAHAAGSHVLQQDVDAIAGDVATRATSTRGFELGTSTASESQLTERSFRTGLIRLQSELPIRFGHKAMVVGVAAARNRNCT